MCGGGYGRPTEILSTSQILRRARHDAEYHEILAEAARKRIADIEAMIAENQDTDQNSCGIGLISPDKRNER